MLLRGDPSLAFRARWNCTFMPACTVLDWLAVVAMATTWRRALEHDHLPAHVYCYIALTAAASLAGIAWRAACARAPDGGSYARRCEPLIAFLRLYGYGFGSGAVWGRAFLEKSGAGGAPSPLRNLLSLFVASGATTSFLLWGRPLVFSLALPIQAAVSLSFTAYTRGLCATSALSSPGALRLAGAVRRALHPAAGIMAASPADLLADCAVLLNFLQLGLGLALPALLQAAAEVRCWRVHQAQRAAARLPPEPGRRQARLYAVLGELLFPLGRPVLLLGALGLYSITWTLAALLAAAW